MPACRVGVLPRALADIERIAKWWRKNRRAAPRLFQDELDLAFINIAAHPEIGHKAGLRAYPGARTYLLRRSEYVVIYNVDDDAGVVAIARVRYAGRRPLARAKSR
jgi:plasmid stabilization system protein ParE